MAWFERYGIPGTYFVALVAGWIYALCPQVISSCPKFIQWNNVDSAAAVLALIAISLPIGYVISIMGQAAYLNWRRCFSKCKWLKGWKGWLGFHGAALDRCGIAFIGFLGDDPTNDEAVIEARFTLKAALSHGLSPERHIYIRDWIRRRMDVFAISFSLFLATLFAVIVFLLLLLWLPGNPSLAPTIILSFISFVVIVIMIWNMRKMRRGLIEVIAGLCRIYLRDDP